MNYLMDDLADYTMEKTARSLGETLYQSNGKLKDVIFGKTDGQNRFNNAYETGAIRKGLKPVWAESTDEFDLGLKKIIDSEYRKSLIDAARRPLAIAGGAGAAIYGGKKLHDKYQARKKNQEKTALLDDLVDYAFEK